MAAAVARLPEESPVVLAAVQVPVPLEVPVGEAGAARAASAREAKRRR